jgi:uncharacterized peroxidase-related enzyme
MAHIKLNNEELPRIIGLMHYRPETAAPLNQLAEVLLRGPSTLSMGERELIAASVSWWNDCHFCHHCHAAASAAHLQRPPKFMDRIKEGLPNEPLSGKMRALLEIARMVQQGGLKVTPDHVARAREHGATDIEIHDTVLIAAAFCMYNRYVDGLATWSPEAKEAYVPIGEKLAFEGYLDSIPS